MRMNINRDECELIGIGGIAIALLPQTRIAPAKKLEIAPYLVRIWYFLVGFSTVSTTYLLSIL